MKNLLAFTICVLYSPAFAQDLCKNLFSTKNLVGVRPSTTLTYDSLTVEQKLAFKNLNLEGELKMVIPIAEGKVSVLVSEIPYDRTDTNFNPRHYLYVVEVESQRIITSDMFTRIKHVSFLSEQKLLAVDGTRPSDGNVAKLYLISLTRSAPPVPYLSLPGSQYWGVGVKAVVSRPDLSAIMVVQDSANALMTIRRPQRNPMVDPNTTVLNQGVYLFDSKTLEPVNSLSYDGRKPTIMRLNPKSSLAAMTITNPVVADRNALAVVVVDSREPHKIIYHYDFKDSGIHLETLPNIQTTIGYRISTQWSADGRSLAIFEKSSGSVIVYDTVTGKETISRRGATDFWPILGATFLDNNQLFIIRQGLRPLGRVSNTPDFFIYLMSTDGITRDEQIPSFPLQLSSVAGSGPRSANTLDITSVLEMRQGRVMALILTDQIIFIDRKDPRQQISLAPNTPTSHTSPWFPAKTISSVEKINDNTLRVSDHEQGVFDITVPEL